MSDLPKFEPLPNVGNVVSNNVTAFNQGYNLYQCINYLQGYVAIVYENMDALLDDWNNFQQVINDNIQNIATEETQRVLNQWLEDGTLNDLIAQNPLWNQKLDKSGGTMTGNIKFSENTKIVGTTPGGNDIDLIHNTNEGASGNYVQFGDPDAKTVINSSQLPVWHNGDDDYLLLTQKQLDDGLAGKVNKSGDTMTGNLNLNASLNIRDEIKWGNVNNIFRHSNHDTELGDEKNVLFIKSKNDVVYLSRSDSNNAAFLTNFDINDTLTSIATNKPLSANQGKVLNDKITNWEVQKVTVEGVTCHFYKNLKYVHVNLFSSIEMAGPHDFENIVPTGYRPNEVSYLNIVEISGTTTYATARFTFYPDQNYIRLMSSTAGQIERCGNLEYLVE